MDLTEIERSQLHQQNEELSELDSAVMRANDLLGSMECCYFDAGCVLQLQEFSRQIQARRRRVMVELSARREQIERYSRLTAGHRDSIRDKVSLLRSAMDRAEYHVERKRKVLAAEGIGERQIVELIPDYDSGPARAEITALETEIAGWGTFFREGRLSDLPTLPDGMELEAA